MFQPTRWLVPLLVTLIALMSSSAFAADIDDLTGNMSWGMTRQQVEQQHRAELIAEYRTAIEGNRDAVRNDRLRRGVDDALERFRATWVEFNGLRTGYESSTIADEVFTGAGLAMLILADADAPKYYIFKEGKLVKIIIATNTATLDYMPFHAFTESLGSIYGRPSDVVTELDDIGVRQEVRSTWTTRKTRLRVENRSSVFNTFLMVLSDASQDDFRRDTRAASAAERSAGGTLDDIFQEVAADTSNRTSDDVVDRIVGEQTRVQVRLRSDARDGEALTSQALGTSAMDDTEVLQDVEKVERRSSSRRSSGSGSSRPSSSTPSGGGRTIY